MRYVALLLLLAWLPFPASAHLSPNTFIEIDVRDTGLEASITVQQSEWHYAYGGQPMTEQSVREMLLLTSDGGAVWPVESIRVDRVTLEGVPDYRARIVAKPPSGSSNRDFRLTWRGVIDRVASHNVMVFARSDFAGGVLSGHPRLIGVLQGERDSLTASLGDPSLWKGFTAAARLGMHHIAEGYDHLAFLLTLLLPAPLIASAGRWSGASGTRATLLKLATIVTAFTIGHSLTLIAGAWGGWSLPVQPVEIGIALSILVSAIHAIRPIFSGREAWVAGGFGLIHGAAFATLIGHFDLPATERAIAILGFNLGIEAVQLLVVLVVAPVLVMLAKTRNYAAIRIGGAALAGLASLYWLWERV